MARVIWSQPGNPPKHVSDRLGIPRWQLEEALHEIKRQAIFVLRIALSDTMMAWSGMRTAMSSATSVTNSESTIRTFATLRLLVMRLIRKRCRVSWKKAQRAPIRRVNPIDLDRVARKSPAKPGYGS